MTKYANQVYQIMQIGGTQCFQREIVARSSTLLRIIDRKVERLVTLNQCSYFFQILTQSIIIGVSLTLHLDFLE